MPRAHQFRSFLRPRFYHLSICLSVCLSVCLSIYLSISLSISLSMFPPLCPLAPTAHSSLGEHQQAEGGLWEEMRPVWGHLTTSLFPTQPMNLHFLKWPHCELGKLIWPPKALSPRRRCGCRALSWRHCSATV